MNARSLAIEAATISLLLFCPLLAHGQLENPVGEDTETRFVDTSMGHATFTIPVPAPVGTGGFAPELALEYESTHQDGPFGVGWRLASGDRTFSMIRRATRFGTPSYTTADLFELDGVLLIESSSTAGEYRTSTETFSRITYDSVGQIWTVEYIDGRVSTYGATAESKIRIGGSTTPETDNGAVAEWLISETRDAFGNAIRFEYDRSVDVGTAYPESVIYTFRQGNVVGGVGSEKRIDFLLEDRDDPLRVFGGGLDSTISKRVYEIRSTVGGNPSAV